MSRILSVIRDLQIDGAPHGTYRCAERDCKRMCTGEIVGHNYSRKVLWGSFWSQVERRGGYLRASEVEGGWETGMERLLCEWSSWWTSRWYKAWKNEE